MRRSFGPFVSLNDAVTIALSPAKATLAAAELGISHYDGGHGGEISALLHGLIVNELDPLTERISAVYIRDSGIAHALLDIETFEDLLGHPVAGSSWGGFVIENPIAAADRRTPYFYRTEDGAEIDLLLERGVKPEVALRSSDRPRLLCRVIPILPVKF
jgi:hypothetical protein